MSLVAGLLAGLPACLRLPEPLEDVQEADLRASAPVLAAPPEALSAQPLVLPGHIPVIGFSFIRLKDPQDYLAYRFEAGDVSLSARVSRVLDDVERAVAQMERLGFQAEDIVEADRARLAILAQALGSGTRFEAGSEIRRRAWRNRAALQEAVATANGWGEAFQAAAERAVVIEPLSDVPGRLSDGLERYDAALRRLVAAHEALDQSFDALPRSGPAIP